MEAAECCPCRMGLCPVARARRRDDQTGAPVVTVGDHSGAADSGFGTGRSHALRSLRLPGKGWPTTTSKSGVGVDDDLVIRGVAEFFDCPATIWSRVETRVPSSISTMSLRNRLCGRSVNRGRRCLITRSAADFDRPKSGASWRSVKFVSQYVVTSRTRSSSGSPHGRPHRTSSALSWRSAVTSLPKQRGLSPANGAIQDGAGAVITPATARSWRHAGPRSTAPPEAAWSASASRPGLHHSYGTAGPA